MSEQKNTRPKVPEGEAQFFKTRQMEATEKGFVGYETIWESFQKEAEYTTPKKPWVLLTKSSFTEMIKRPSLEGLFSF